MTLETKRKKAVGCGEAAAQASDRLLMGSRKTFLETIEILGIQFPDFCKRPVMVKVIGVCTE
ncbi:hypothetical protein WT13_05905 [Burkholderia anthina]|nr:hypothetical protein WT13_05905 [Burkholderia anthina]